jgi:hypothetical protein
MSAVSSFQQSIFASLVESGEERGMLGQGPFSNLENRQHAVQYAIRDSKTEMLN